MPGGWGDSGDYFRKGSPGRLPRKEVALDGGEEPRMLPPSKRVQPAGGAAVLKSWRRVGLGAFKGLDKKLWHLSVTEPESRNAK